MDSSFEMRGDYDPENDMRLFNSSEDHPEFSGCGLPLREDYPGFSECGLPPREDHPSEVSVPIDGENCYEVLKVAPSASNEEIEAAFSVEVGLLERSIMPWQPPVYAEQAALLKLRFKRARDTLIGRDSRDLHDAQLAVTLGREYKALAESDKRLGTVVLEESLWSKGFTLTDKRDKGGVLWISASQAFAPLFQTVFAVDGQSFRFGYGRRRGWWTKSSRLLV